MTTRTPAQPLRPPSAPHGWPSTDTPSARLTSGERPKGRARMLAIDDQGAMGSWNADLLLDQNLAAGRSLLSRCSRTTPCLFGPRFALLRREVRSAIRSPVAEASEAVRRVLVAFGGSDPAGLTSIAIEAVTCAGLGDVEVIAVVGPASTAAESLLARYGPSDNRVEVVVDPSDYASRLAGADLAVVAAGSTCWELAAFGVPAVVSAVAPNQRVVADGLAAAGAVVDVGPPGTWSAGDLARAVRELASDSARRRSMASVGRRLVDGLGAERVVAAMQEVAMAASTPSGGRS